MLFYIKNICNYSGHNTDGKYFLTSTKLSYHFETVPKHIAFFFEKSKDGHVTPIKDVVIVDFSCGNNHTVSFVILKYKYWVPMLLSSI